MFKSPLSPASLLARVADTVMPDKPFELGPVDPEKPRVLYFVTKYPEFSETYIHEEMVAVARDYNVKIVDYERARDLRRSGLPHIFLKYVDSNLAYGSFDNVDTTFGSRTQQRFLDRVSAVIDAYRPQVLHAHYFPNVWLLRALAERHDIPFTIRTHSFDMLNVEAEKMRSMLDAANTPYCLRIYTFPEFRDGVIRHGFSPERVQAYWPILKVVDFHDTTPRTPTGQIMCAGPCTPKKSHDEFIDLAALMQGSGFRFNLYAKGFGLKKVQRHNEAKGSPVNIGYVDPQEMPGVYRRHDWLVYPSNQKINKVGLPVAVVEAQASGIGVCLQELPGRRQAQLDFLGGAGFLFQSIEELPAILSKPYPEEMRQKGFENCMKCDVANHRDMLAAAWKDAIDRPSVSS